MRAKRTDANHAEIRDILRTLGCDVVDTSHVGKGFPDLVVGRSGITELVEVKDGKKPPSRRKLREDQDYFRVWKGRPLKVIETVEDAVDLANAMLDEALNQYFPGSAIP